MKKLLAFLGLALLLLIAVLCVRASLVRSRQVQAPLVTDLAVDANAAAGRLAGALRFPTISHEDGTQVESQAFLDLHRFLEQTFPKVHATLKREVVADYSLLYTWPGKDPKLAPILLMSHQDVVPVEPGTEKDWTHPAFSGDVADGFVWGRGALDDKAGVTAILEAIETLLDRGFQPRRTVLLAFGHDEEVGDRTAPRPSPPCWRSGASTPSSSWTRGAPSWRAWCRGSLGRRPWWARPRRAR